METTVLQGISDADDAALYGGLGGGIAGGVLAVVGVLSGLFAERVLQRYGKLYCTVSGDCKGAVKTS